MKCLEKQDGFIYYSHLASLARSLSLSLSLFLSLSLSLFLSLSLSRVCVCVYVRVSVRVCLHQTNIFYIVTFATCPPRTRNATSCLLVAWLTALSFTNNEVFDAAQSCLISPHEVAFTFLRLDLNRLPCRSTDRNVAQIQYCTYTYAQSCLISPYEVSFYMASSAV
jgi:hypothetical protein